ncbi:MAG: phage tail tape measure protein [Firmicutes bacterium]|nr:phage tail tape measure protein [Bacillota bacterium]
MTVDIGPRVGISGERAFRRDLQSIGNQLKITRAEMDKVINSFEDSEQSCKRSAEALVVMHRQLKLLREQQERAGLALQNAARTYGESSAQADKWRLVIAKSEAEQAKLEKSIKQTQSAIVQNTKIVKENAVAVDGNVTALSDLGGVLAGAGLAAGLKTLADAMWSTVEASVEFESAITGVYKTVDGTPAYLAELAKGIKELAGEIPASATELAGVAEAAGQLGIARENILDFTRTMTMLGTATNMSADEAATALARFANVAGTDAADYSRLGSVIVALGNNFATTESEITEMAQRLASAGTLARLSEAEILALAASMSSVGIEAEAGGTAMTQTLAAISEAAELGGDKLNKLARVAGMSAESFSQLWAQDAVSALQQFILGLGRLEAEGESSIMVLDELGMSGVRQSNMLRSLSLAGEQLTGTVKLASGAWAENTALTKEAEQRYDTTESKLQLLANANERLAAAYGDTLTPAIDRFTESTTDVVNATAELVEEYPELARGLTAAASSAATFVAVSAGFLTVATYGERAAKALAAIKVAAMSNPWALAAAGAAGLSAAILTFAATSERAQGEFAGLAGSVREAGREWHTSIEQITAQADKTRQLADQLLYLQKCADGSAAASQALQNVQQALLEAAPALTAYINAETGALEGNWRQALENAAAADEQAAAMERKAAVAAQLSEVQAELFAREAEMQRLEAEGITLAEAAGGGYSKLDPAMREKCERMVELAAAANELQRAETELLRQQEELEAATAGWTAQNNTAESSLYDVAGAVDSAIGRLNTLAEDYETVRAAARQSLDEQTGLFEDMSLTAVTSIAELQQALDSQAKFMEDYADNLRRAAERGVDEGILAKLQDGSQESAAALAALADAAETEIARINSSFAETQAAKDYLAEEIAYWQTGADEILSSIDRNMQEAARRMDVSEDARQSAANTLQGYIDGIESSSGVLYAKMRTVAGGALSSFNAALDIHSPSREFAKSGRNSMQGYINGAGELTDSVREAMQSIGRAALDSFGDGAAAGSTATMAAMQAEADAAWKLAQSSYRDFDSLQKALKNARQADLFSEEMYYKKLAALRDMYLAPGGDDWTDISLDIYKYEADKLEDAINDFLKAYEAALEGAAAATEDVLDGIKDEYNDLLKEQEKMRNTLADYSKLYNETSLKYSDGSTGEYYRLADLDDQIEALREYRAVLDSLEERELNGGLMDEVLGMDVDEAVRYGRELLKKSDAEWAEYNRQWEEKQALAAEIAEEFYRDELNALEEDYAAALREGLDGLKEISNNAGENVVAGLINGMEAKEAELNRQMQEIADVIEEGLRESLDMHSPSRRLMNLGEMAGDGLLLGWDEKLDTFRESVLSAVPSDLTVNYAAAGGRERDGTMLDALGTMFGASAMPGGDMTVIFRINDIDFARATLPAFRRAGAENPVVEVDF